jgi:hypothetical protein
MRQASAIVRGLIWYCVPPDGNGVATNSGDERESEPFGPIVSRSPAVVSTFRVGGSPRCLEISMSKQSGSSCAASSASQLSPVLLLQLRQRRPDTFFRPPSALEIRCSSESVCTVIVFSQRTQCPTATPSY